MCSRLQEEALVATKKKVLEWQRRCEALLEVHRQNAQMPQ